MPEYLVDRDTEPMKCPKCGSPNISAQPVEQYGGGTIYQPVICNVCDFKWSERYDFVDWEPT